MSNGILTADGRIYKAELYKLANAGSSPASVVGPYWCAIGQGDGTFTDPNNPPLESAGQTGLSNEKIRKKFTSLDFLVEDALGTIIIGARKFSVSVNPTGIVLLQYLFDFTEANFTWKEIGFFGGNVAFGDFYNGSAPPIASGISGITVNYVSPENGAGTGTLAYTASGTTLTWKAPGSSTAGAAVNVGAGGNFLLSDGVDTTKKIRVVVTAGSLPGSNTSVTPSITVPGTVAFNGLNSTGNPTGQVASNGRLFFVRNIIDAVKTSSSQRPVRFLLEP